MKPQPVFAFPPLSSRQAAHRWRLSVLGIFALHRTSFQSLNCWYSTRSPSTVLPRSGPKPVLFTLSVVFTALHLAFALSHPYRHLDPLHLCHRNSANTRIVNRPWKSFPHKGCLLPYGTLVSERVPWFTSHPSLHLHPSAPALYCTCTLHLHCCSSPVTEPKRQDARQPSRPLDTGFPCAVQRHGTTTSAAEAQSTKHVNIFDNKVNIAQFLRR